MKKAIYHKIDNYPFAYRGFQINKTYDYFTTTDDCYFVVNQHETRCCFDKQHFNEFFIDLKQYRKLKILKIQKLCNSK